MIRHTLYETISIFDPGVDVEKLGYLVFQLGKQKVKVWTNGNFQLNVNHFTDMINKAET